MAAQRIRILIVDDHPMMRKGLTATIAPETDLEVVGAAKDGKEAVELFRRERPDLTIMDLTLTREMTGIQAIQAIRREFPEARIIVLSAYQGDETIYQALHAGAITYLLKETLGDDLIPILREVHAGGGPIPPEVARRLADRVHLPMLTSRETEVLHLVKEGLRNKEIASRLYVSEATVQGHIRNLLSKLGAHDRTEALVTAIRRGIIRLD